MSLTTATDLLSIGAFAQKSRLSHKAQGRSRGRSCPALRDGRGVTTAPDNLDMDQQPRLVSVTTRIASEEFGLEVDVRLRELGGRWLAVAEFDGEPEVGIGATPRAALAASLATLGNRAAAALMADPALFGASVLLRQPA